MKAKDNTVLDDYYTSIMEPKYALADEYKYNDDPHLGKVMTKISPFCKLMIKTMDDLTLYDIIGKLDSGEYPGVVGKMWSRICGFTFRSIYSSLPPLQLVFVPKLNNNDGHKNGRGLSGWYCWKSFGITRKQVIPIQKVMEDYNFNVCHFFRSDIFNKSVPIFIKNISTVVDKRLPQILESLPEFSLERKELERAMKSIRNAVSIIGDVQKYIKTDIEMPDEGGIDKKDKKTFKKKKTIKSKEAKVPKNYPDRKHLVSQLAPNAHGKYTLSNDRPVRPNANSDKDTDASQPSADDGMFA